MPQVKNGEQDSQDCLSSSWSSEWESQQVSDGDNAVEATLFKVGTQHGTNESDTTKTIKTNETIFTIQK